MSQSLPIRFVNTNCAAIVKYLRSRAGIAAIALATSFTSTAYAVDRVIPAVDTDAPAVEAKADDEPTPVSLELDRDNSNRLTQPVVDFDFDLPVEAKKTTTNDVDKTLATETKSATVVEEKTSNATTSEQTDTAKSAATPAYETSQISKVPPFSAAFTNALKDIAAFDQKSKPTPATDLTTDVTSNDATGLKSLKNAVEANVTDASKAEAAAKLAESTKQKLDLAAEVPTAIPTITTKPTAAIKKDAIAPSVANRKPSVTATQANPLKADLEKYFEGFEQKSNPSGVAIKSPAEPEVETQAVPTPAPPPISNFPAETNPRYQYREPAVVISRSMAALQPKIAKNLRYYFDRPLNTRDDSAWSVMHSFLGYGPNGMVAINSDRGQRTNAVSWMCQNGPLMGRRLLYLDNGYIKGVEGAGYQGHPCQFLAMLAQINIPRDYPLVIQGRTLDVEDLVNSEMYTCASDKELTFKLIAFSHYLNSDATWKSENGETWTIPQILTEEMAQPVNGAACGGTHRIMAIAFAVKNRQLRGEPIDGAYVPAQAYVRQYQRYIMSLQNRDGSFSTNWLKGRADNGDKDRQLQTTGHILELLVYSLPRNELSDPRVVKAVEFLNNLMSRNRKRDWEVGPRGHAIRALSLYHRRVFERQTPPRLAAKPVR